MPPPLEDCQALMNKIVCIRTNKNLLQKSKFVTHLPDWETLIMNHVPQGNQSNMNLMMSPVVFHIGNIYTNSRRQEVH